MARGGHVSLMSLSHVRRSPPPFLSRASPLHRPVAMILRWGGNQSTNGVAYMVDITFMDRNIRKMRRTIWFDRAWRVKEAGRSLFHMRKAMQRNEPRKTTSQSRKPTLRILIFYIIYRNCIISLIYCLPRAKRRPCGRRVEERGASRQKLRVA